MTTKNKLDLVDLEPKAIYRIFGRINGKRDGVFYGFTEENEPVFGGGNLIHAPTWWNTTYNNVLEVCNKIMFKYPHCEAYPNKIN